MKRKFSGEATVIFIFAFLVNRGKLLKKRICSKGMNLLKRQIFLRVDKFLEGAHFSGKQTNVTKNVSEKK